MGLQRRNAWTGDMAQVVEYLSSNPSTAKKKKKKSQEEMLFFWGKKRCSVFPVP
jgi:hypothetical protein